MRKAAPRTPPDVLVVDAAEGERVGQVHAGRYTGCALSLHILLKVVRLPCDATIGAMANRDRLTALDATFLHLESAGAHMHVASVHDLRGRAARPTTSSSRRSRGACTSSPATASGWRRCRSARAARCGSTTRTSTPATTCATPRCPRPAARAAASNLAGRAVLPAAGPRQAAVGDLARGGLEGDRFALHRQDPPRARRRHLAASTSPPCCSTRRPTRAPPAPPERRGCRGPCPAAPSCWPRRCCERATDARPRSCAACVRCTRGPRQVARAASASAAGVGRAGLGGHRAPRRARR